MGLAKAELERTALLLGGRAEVAAERIYGGLDLGDEGHALKEAFNQACVYAGLNLKKRNLLIARFVVWLLLGIIILGLTSNLFYCAVALVPLLIEWIRLKKLAKKRARLFEQDYCAFLLSIASSVKGGADPILALSQATSLFPPGSVLQSQIAAFKVDLETGLTEEQALLRFAASINNQDIGMFRSAMIIARKEGSALGECLQRLAKVTRQRQSFSRKVKSAVAMQKMASMGIAGCTVVIGMIQYFANPDGLIKAWNHSIGFPIMIAGVILIGVGLIWMQKLAGKEM